jgi:hypothetical protein
MRVDSHALVQNKGLMSFPIIFNKNKMHDSIVKALRTSSQSHGIANSHKLSSSFDPVVDL